MTMPNDKKQRYDSMDIVKADAECGKRRRPAKKSCPACSKDVILHCEDCRIQVTGCICTMVERHGHEEAMRMLVQQHGQRGAEQRLRDAGLWLPHG